MQINKDTTRKKDLSTVRSYFQIMISLSQTSSMEHFTPQNFCPNCREMRWMLPCPEAYWPEQAVKSHCRTREAPVQSSEPTTCLFLPK